MTFLEVETIGCMDESYRFLIFAHETVVSSKHSCYLDTRFASNHDGIAYQIHC